MTKSISLACAFTLALVACGKGGSGGGADKAAPDPVKANAAIPTAWKGKLEFVVGEGGSKRDKFAAIVPKGWKEGFMPGSVAPPDGSADFAHGTDYAVDSTCQGMCGEAKDWPKVADETYFAQFTSGQSGAKVVKDEKTPTRRTMIAASSDTTYIYVVWWEDGGGRMYSCEVKLTDRAQELTPAFEAACLGTAGG